MANGVDWTLITLEMLQKDWAEKGIPGAEEAFAASSFDDLCMSLEGFQRRFTNTSGQPEIRGWTEDEVISAIENGNSIARIATQLGCNRSVLWRWLEADEQRSARSVRARQIAAGAWDEMAQKGIEDAKDPFELSKAKEMAHHYRWRASKIAPKVYGEKTETTLTGPDGGPVQIARKLDNAELMAIAAQALPKT